MKHFHCPVKDWNCPYCEYKAIIEEEEEYCLCTLKNPYEECDDFYSKWGDDCNSDDYTDDTDDN